MSDLPNKLRQHGANRRQLGGHPCGYQYFFDAADEIENLRKTVDNLKYHNRGLQAELNKVKAATICLEEK